MATALSEGEARRKHVVMIEILGQQVRCGCVVNWCRDVWGQQVCGGGSEGAATVAKPLQGSAVAARLSLPRSPMLVILSALPSLPLPLFAQWRTVKHPLDSVRPFQFSSVTLADQIELDPANQEGVTGEVL